MTENTAKKSKIDPNNKLKGKRMGFNTKHFELTPEQIQESTHEKTVGRYSIPFKLEFSPLSVENRILPGYFLIMISETSYDAHGKSLPLDGFGSHLCFDYGDAMHEIFIEYCIQNNLEIHEHVNSWPKFQAIVTPQKA